MNDPRYVRKMILKALHAQHPGWVTDELLLFTLADLGCAASAEELSSELVYLRDWPQKGDGYVELQIDQVPGTGEEIFKSRIAPKGINLVEKMSAADPNIFPF